MKATYKCVQTVIPRHHLKGNIVVTIKMWIKKLLRYREAFSTYKNYELFKPLHIWNS